MKIPWIYRLQYGGQFVDDSMSQTNISNSVFLLDYTKSHNFDYVINQIWQSNKDPLHLS